MKILVTGAAGMLGSAVMRRLAVDHQVAGIDLVDGDLTQDLVVRELMALHQPDWVIHCAAWTAVDEAETAMKQAMAANRDATVHLVAACDEMGSGLTFISTDYVFNGEGPDTGFPEDWPRDPINYYGRTKAAAEAAVEAMEGLWQIVRISWLFGDGPVNFPRTIARLLDRRETLMVVNDQLGCPTYTVDLAEVLAFLVSGRYRGIFHGANTGSCTWFDFAREVAQLTGADPERIKPCASSDFPTAAERPRNSVLLSSALEEIGCPPRPRWQDALSRYLHLLESGEAPHSQ